MLFRNDYLLFLGNFKPLLLGILSPLITIRMDQVSTERILFLCEQSLTNKGHSTQNDDITKQAEDNMMAYAALFIQLEEVTSS